MAPRKISPRQLGGLLPRNSVVWLQACSTESRLIRDGLVEAGEELAGTTFCGIFSPGLNRLDYATASERRVVTFFMTPELNDAGERVTYLPFCYKDVLSFLRKAEIAAALFMVSPPDGDGLCSFGPVGDFLPDLWPSIPIRIAHVNPRVPRTHGRTRIPYSEITALLEGEEELPAATAGSDETCLAIGELIAPLVPDGSTIQAGVGRVPEAALSALKGHSGLAIHSGLVGDSALELLEAGSLRTTSPIVAGVAIGSRRLYDAVSDEAFRFEPVSYTHSIDVIRGIDGFVTINSAIEVDLFGQAYSELTRSALISGPGGASDFAMGARANNGTRIIALPSTAAGGSASRIVAPASNSGLVSLGRFDTDVFVTEHGVADLRGKTHAQRAASLIEIAAPAFRDQLARDWERWSRSNMASGRQ